MLKDEFNLTDGQIKKGIKIIFAIIIFVVFLVSMGSIVENLPADVIVINQIPIFGTLEYWTEPGWNGQWFGDITEYDKTFQIWFSNKENMGSSKDQSIKIVFNDAGEGWISGSARIKLPTDNKHLKLIHVEFGSMKALVNDLIMPTLNKVVFSSGPLMSSFESYAAKKNDLISTYFYNYDEFQNWFYSNRIEMIQKIKISVKNSWGELITYNSTLEVFESHEE